MDLCYVLVPLCRIFSDYNGSILFEPPKVLNFGFYKCDTKFHLDKILDMYDTTLIFAIVLISGKEYRFYTVHISGLHKEFKLLKSDTEHLQKKQKKGGFSAPRFERIRQEKELHYIRKMLEQMVKVYTNIKYTGMLIGGPADIKNSLIQEPLFAQYFSNKLLKIVTTSEITDNTVHEIYNNNYNLFHDTDASPMSQEVKLIMNEFNTLLSFASNKLVFGEDVINELKNNMLSKIIVNKNLDKEQKNLIRSLLNKNCYLIEVSEQHIKNYGNYIGIRWFDMVNLCEDT